MSEWHDVTLADISDQRKGINYKSEYYCDEDSGHPFITIKCFVKGGGYQSRGIKYFDGPFTPQDKLSAGDVLISVTDLTRAGDIVGSPLQVPDFGSERSALASMDCMKIAPQDGKCDSEFLYFRMMLPDIRRQMIAYSAGSTVLHLDTKKVPSMKIRIPKDIGHQKKLARVLKLLTEAIERTEALIEKYSLVKAGMMHDLFTRGLTPDGKLRPPREEAPDHYKETPLGWVPVEWDIQAIGELFQIQLGKMLSKASKTGKNTMPYLGNKNVQWDDVDLRNLETMDFSETEKNKFKLEVGDLLVCEGGDVGRTAMWKGEKSDCYYQKAIHRLRAIDANLTSKFMLRFMRYAKDVGIFNNFTSQSSIAHLTQEKLAKVKMFLPPVQEQVEIDQRFDAIDDRVRNETRRLGKLLLQKYGLMHDLLTGEVPVTVNDPEAAHV